MTGYEAFALYNSLKIHFTQKSYDYFKYNGKSNISVQTFELRKDKYYFYKLSRKYSREEFVKFLVSNFIIDNKIWVGKLLEEDAESIYKLFLMSHQSLSYIFDNDCRELFIEYSNPNDILKVEDGEYPILLTKTLRKETQFETLCILNDMLGFFPMWSRKIDDTIRWPEVCLTASKYTPFIDYDKAKFQDILRSHLQSVYI
jgi:hypothetical protein